MGGVFINYRGEDSTFCAALIDHELSARFGSDLVFRDCRSISAGDDFVTSILGNLLRCNVLLVVIGPRWLTLTDDAGRRRIDTPGDWIHREIAEAFEQGMRVIPVLTDDADIPREAELPAGIARLSRCQYLRLHYRDDEYGLARLADKLVEVDEELAAVARQRRQPPARTVPRQLPLGLRHFVGRTEELDTLDGLLAEATTGAGTVVISAIDGTAGIGKTALAVHWARRVADRFPDGQLYVNLRGFDLGPPMRSGEALDVLLFALGVAPESVPREVEAQAGLFRTLLADRRMLVVLDNARNAEQVRPLVSGAAGCFTLITSRNRMAGLAMQVPLHQITVDTLSPAEALALLRRVAGAERVDAEPDAAQELLRRCAYLPLAIYIAADRVAASRHLRIADVVRQLSQRALDMLATPDDDERAAVRVVLSWSYRALTPEVQRCFRLLALHPGHTCTPASAAELVGSPVERVGQILRRLADAHLIDEVGTERFQFHDLLREYAHECTSAADEPADRDTAVRRLLSWYLRTTTAANRVLAPHRRGTGQAAPGPFLDHPAALDWCDAEVNNLAAATRLAVEVGDDEVAAQLPIAMWGYLSLRKPWTTWMDTHEWGLVAARRSGDRHVEAHLLTNISICLRDRREMAESMTYSEQALRIRREIGDRWGEAWSLTILGGALCELDRADEAISLLRAAVEVRHEVGDTQGLGRTLSFLGDAYRQVRRFDEAVECYEQAREIAGTLGNPRVLGLALRGLAAAYHDLGASELALALAGDALDVASGIGDRLEEAQAHALRGSALTRLGNYPAARAAWHEALRVFDELGDSRAEQARRSLREIPASVN
jgi:tetratricopeptide (TPR) repeat protein